MKDVNRAANRVAGRPWLAALWGFAEATCFFIVPDVLTSRLVIRRTSDGFAACLWAALSAILGGLLLFLLGRYSALAPSLFAFFDLLPGISPAMIERVNAGVAAHGFGALFTGALSGIPYKLYAVTLGTTDLGLVAFVLWSAAARFARFTAVTGVVWVINRLLANRFSERVRLWTHALAWSAFYIWYFAANRG